MTRMIRPQTAPSLLSPIKTKTLNETFQSFLTSLELTNTQSELVSKRQNETREHVIQNSQMHIESSILIGSYARSSQIRPLPNDPSILDVDALLILDHNSWSNISRYWNVNDGGTALLQDTLKALSGYRSLSVKIDRPSITISWNDMKMELTPAFRAKGGGFLIPSKNIFDSKWTFTDPISDASSLTKANQFCRNELKPLTKMLKCWDRRFGKPIGSFTIETVAFHSATFYKYCGYIFEIQFFFGRLLQYDGYIIPTPSGIGDFPLVSLGNNRELIETCKYAADLAYDAEKNGDSQTASAFLSCLFGKPFPGAK